MSDFADSPNWYAEYYNDSAMLSEDFAEEVRFLHEFHKRDLVLTPAMPGGWMGAYIDCLLDGRQVSLWRAP